jgi:hypothetical protein
MEQHYRFKTEEEFIADFGEDWRRTFTISGKWNHRMDKNFGKPILLKNADAAFNMNKDSAGTPFIGYAGATIRKSCVIPLKEDEFASEFDLIDRVSYNAYDYSVKIDGRNSCTIIKEVTGNCQLSSISCFCYLVDRMQYTPQFIGTVLKIAAIKGSLKPLLLFDIQEKYAPYVAKIPEVAYTLPYESTNGSKMLMGLIKL